MRPPRMEEAARTAKGSARAATGHDAFSGPYEPLAEAGYRHVGDVLTEMHMTPLQSAYERKLHETDSVAYALERVFKVGP